MLTSPHFRFPSFFIFLFLLLLSVHGELDDERREKVLQEERNKMKFIIGVILIVYLKDRIE